jgi:hypothetical protein
MTSIPIYLSAQSAVETLFEFLTTLTFVQFMTKNTRIKEMSIVTIPRLF